VLQAAIENEVAAYLDLFKEIKDDKGRCMVVGHGSLPERSILTGIGPLLIKEVAKKSKPLANKRLRLIKALFNYGIKRNWFRFNPANRID
jgi:hypothetical protein